MNRKFVLASALAAVVAAPVHAAISVDEATYPGAAGDYNNLLLVAVPVPFDLAGGTNVFRGTFGTPGDGGDTLLLGVGVDETITALRITFATNAGPFNPVAINQGSHLVLDTSSSSSATPLLDLAVTGRPDGPVVFSSAPLTLGPELYNLTLLTQVLALSNNGKVGYEIAIDVLAVPEPRTAGLLALGLALLAFAARRMPARRTARFR
jgi:hypothetical protein